MILYSNGVVYIERRGAVTGKVEINLSFKQSQVDDVLKSMVVLDRNQGKIGAVSYNSSAPASARMSEIPFSVGATSPEGSGIAGVLAQLQGAKVSVATAKGIVVGSVLTVERKTVRNDKETTTTNMLVLASDNGELVRQVDVVILAVKPQIMTAVLREIAPALTRQKLVISLAAGVSTARIRAALGREVRLIRVMPNTPALVLEGATAIARAEGLEPDDLDTASEIFSAVGRVVVLEEDLMDAVTGLSGSGPAYVALVLESLADGGVKMGLDRITAMTLATQTVLGAAKLVLETGMHPGALKDMVSSPGGTSIAGISALEEGGIRTTFIKAVERATQRSRELGQGPA